MLASKLNALKEEVVSKVNSATTALELTEIRNEYLSKKGKLSSFMVELKNVSNELKPKMGQLINETKSFVSTLIDSKLKELQEKEGIVDFPKDLYGKAFMILAITVTELLNKSELHEEMNLFDIFTISNNGNNNIIYY